MVVRETADNPRYAPAFPIHLRLRIIRAQSPPVRRREIIVRQALLATFGDNAGCTGRSQVSQLARHLPRFSARQLPVFLGVAGLKHQAHFTDLAPRRHSLHVPIKMDCATLPAGVGQYSYRAFRRHRLLPEPGSWIASAPGPSGTAKIRASFPGLPCFPRSHQKLRDSPPDSPRSPPDRKRFLLRRPMHA